MEQSYIKTKNHSGQSLVEILIAVSVGAIFIIAAGTLIAVTMRLSSQNKFLQPASFLAQDLIDKVSVYAERQWYCGTTCSGNYGIYNLAKGSGNHYRFQTAAVPFQWQTGDETVNLNDVSYLRHFYVENICRDNNGNIIGVISPPQTCSLPNLEDPSTQKVTAAVSWNQAGSSGEVKIAKFLTRSRNNVLVQTDWSGRPTNPILEVLVKPNNKFFNSSAIDYDTPGEIMIEEGEIGVGA